MADERSVTSLLEKPIAPHLEKIPGTFDLPGIEVFSVGTWNEQKFSKSDLAAMVESFEPNVKHLHPWATINHSELEELADLLPEEDRKSLGVLEKSGIKLALGHISRLYTNESAFTDAQGNSVGSGERLFADLVNLPRSIAHAIVHRNVQRPSVELRFGWFNKVTGKKWPVVVQAVSFEGAELEAVTNLGDIFRQYLDRLTPERFDDSSLVQTFTAGLGGKPMPAKFEEGQDLRAVMQEIMAPFMGEMLNAIKSLAPASAEAADEEEPDAMAALVGDEEKAEEEEEMSESAAVPAPVAAPAAVNAASTETARQFAEISARVSRVESENGRLKRALVDSELKRHQVKADTVAASFAAKHSSEKVCRFSPRLRDLAAYLHAHAPNGKTVVKFSEGGGKPAMDYREAFAKFVEQLPDNSHLFQNDAKDLSPPAERASGGSTPSVVKMAESRAAEKSINFNEALDEIFRERPELYASYRRSSSVRVGRNG